MEDANDFSDPDYFYVPITWEVADFLIKTYQKDWEGVYTNNADLDAWFQTLVECNEKHSRIHFPHMFPDRKEEV